MQHGCLVVPLWKLSTENVILNIFQSKIHWTTNLTQTIAKHHPRTFVVVFWITIPETKRTIITKKKFYNWWAA